MTERPLLLDLFSGDGGAAMGYHRAGWDILGVDIVDRPRYPFRFVKADALDVLRTLIQYPRHPRPIFVHTSPPCQAGHSLNAGGHPQLVPPVRELCTRLGIPFLIEQPTMGQRPGLIRRDLTLCMDMFYAPDYPPPWVQRHRSFELHGVTVPQPAHVPHRGYVRGHRHGTVRSGAEAPYVAAYGKGGGKATVAEMQHAMMIDWTDDHFWLREAIPPAYTEYIGRHLLPQLTAGRPDHNGLSAKEA